MQILTPEQLKEHNRMLLEQGVVSEDKEIKIMSREQIDEHNKILEKQKEEGQQEKEQQEIIDAHERKSLSENLDKLKKEIEVLEKKKSNLDHTHSEFKNIALEIKKLDNDLNNIHTELKNVSESIEPYEDKPIQEKIITIEQSILSLSERISWIKIPEVDLTGFLKEGEVYGKDEVYNKDETYNRKEVDDKIRYKKSDGWYNYINDDITDPYFTRSSTKITAAIAAEVDTPWWSNTQVQFNDWWVLWGDAGFEYNKTTNRLSVELLTTWTITTTNFETANFDASGTGEFGNIIVNWTTTLSDDTSIGLVSATEIGYVNWVTSAIQTQLDSKGRQLFNSFTNATVGWAESDIYTNTLATNTFNVNGDKVVGEYGGNFVTVGTEIVQLKVYLAGTAIWDSTGIAVTTGTSSRRVYVEFIRVSSTVVRYSVSLNTTGASGFVYCTVGELTGLTLSNTNILKITGTSSGVGSGSGDIIGRMAYIESKPAA